MKRIFFPEEIETKRLFMRKPNLSDASSIYQNYASDPEVTRFLGWRAHNDISETASFLEYALDQWEFNQGAPYVVFDKTDSDTIIGMIHPHIDSNEVIFGYVYGKPWWGKGFASEALTKLVQITLNDNSIKRCSAFCDIEHKASMRVMEKAGLSYQGILKNHFIHPNISSEPRDCALYFIAK